MAKYKIFYGLGGGFGGANECETAEFETEANAVDYAYECACNEYESYAGMHGFRDCAEIIEEENCSADEAEEIYNEERESWLDYWVEKVKECK